MRGWEQQNSRIVFLTIRLLVNHPIYYDGISPYSLFPKRDLLLLKKWSTYNRPYLNVRSSFSSNSHLRLDEGCPPLNFALSPSNEIVWFIVSYLAFHNSRFVADGARRKIWPNYRQCLFFMHIVSLSIYVSACMSICLVVCQCVCLLIVCLSSCLSLSLSACLAASKTKDD